MILDTYILGEHHGSMTASTDVLFHRMLTGRLLQSLVYMMLLCIVVLG
jgi:hypothetical protein